MRALLLLAACSLLPSAHAALTPVNPRGGGDGDERCLIGTYCTAGDYRGALSIVAAFERDLGLAAGSLQRVDDAHDKLWSVLAPDAAVRPFARYAGDRSVLGWSGESGFSALSPRPRGQALKNERVLVDHRSIFRRTREHGDFRTNRSPWTDLPDGLASFAFVLNNRSSSLYLSSDTSLGGFGNSGRSEDWMITYRVPGQNLYLIAWEDRAAARHGRPNDYDYNDLVYLVRGAAPVMTPQDEPQPNPTPLPASFSVMLLGLAGLGFAVRRRPRRAPGRRRAIAD